MLIAHHHTASNDGKNAIRQFPNEWRMADKNDLVAPPKSMARRSMRTYSSPLTAFRPPTVSSASRSSLAIAYGICP
jgi:hypothetical protein